jgi:hypothetical protein
MRQRINGYIDKGSNEASCPQYSKSVRRRPELQAAWSSKSDE